MLKKLIARHKRHPPGPVHTLLLLLICLVLGFGAGDTAPQVQAAGQMEDEPTLSVLLEGPQMGETGIAYQLTARVEPDPGAEPVTYTWEATDQERQVNEAGASNSVSYSWETGGLKIVQVTASSAAGTDTAELEILISQTRTLFYPALQRACAPLIDEDFSDPSSNWPVAENEAVLIEYHQEAYRILIKEPDWVVAVNSGAALTAQSSLEVRVRNPAGVFGSYGLLFGLAPDFSQTYVFEIYPDGWYAVWFYQQEAGWTLLQAEEAADILPAAAGDHLRIEFLEGRAQFYVNERFLALLSYSVEAANPYSGLIVSSFDWGGVDARFDDFQLTTRNCNGTTNSRYSMPARPAAVYQQWERGGR